MNFLGLDISTSVVGFCVMNDKLEIVEYGYCDISEIQDIYEKLSNVKEKICSLNDEYDLDGIFVENFLFRFAAGKSRIQTLIKLCEFNTLIKYECLLLGKKPVLLNVLHARKIALGKSSSKEFNSVKDFVISIINTIYPDIKWEWVYKKRKKETVLDSRCYDIADSMVICRAGIIERNEIQSNREHT